MRSKLSIYTNKQKALIMTLLQDPSFESAAVKLGISKRSVYRRVRGIKNRLAKREASNRKVFQEIGKDR